jgi:hypothetical protein
MALNAGGRCITVPVKRSAKKRLDLRARGRGDSGARRAERHLGPLALHVIGGGERGQVDGGQVPLLGGHQRLDLPRALADRQHQYPGGQRVQRAGMAGTRAPGPPPNDGDRLHAGEAEGLVEGEDAVEGFHASEPTFGLRRARNHWDRANRQVLVEWDIAPG